MHGFITQMVPPCDQILRNFVQILLTVENIYERSLFIYIIEKYTPIRQIVFTKIYKNNLIHEL